MAFLCPSRLGRKKQKKDNFYDLKDKSPTANGTDRCSDRSLGRPRLIVLQNFTSDDADELSVKQGQKVTFVFREGDWAYVVTDDGKEGFVPSIYCAQLGQSPVTPTSSPLKEQHGYIQSAVFQPPHKHQPNLPQTQKPNNDAKRKLESFSSNKAYGSDDNVSICSSLSDSTTYDTPDSVQAFLKTATWVKRPSFLDLEAKPVGTTNGHICSANPSEKCGAVKTEATPSSNKISPHDRDIRPLEMCKVLYNYEGSGIDDIHATAGDMVCVMDGDDMFLWVQKEDRSEGYIPKYYLQRIEPDELSPRSMHGSSDSSPGFSKKDGSNKNNTIPRSPVTPRDSHVTTSGKQKGVPSNTQIMNIPVTKTIDIIDTDVKESHESKHVPAKPPRKKKVKGSSWNEHGDLFHRQLSDEVFESDWDTMSEQTLDTDTEGQESLTDSMKFGLIQKELQKLAPLQHNESIATYISASSIDGAMMDNDAHHQLDQLRPPSAPPYKMYKYQREKADYYDEYFYDDSNLDVKDSDKNEVINVAEILEIRDALHRVGGNDTRTSLRSKVLPHTNIAANLKQYMLTLPTTVLGYGGVTAGQANTKTAKGTRRYYVSQVEDDDSVLYSQPNKVKTKQPITDNAQGTKATPPETKDNNQSPTTKVTLKKHDWSFGYPRKTKTNSYTQEINHNTEKEKTIIDRFSNSNSFISDYDLGYDMDQDSDMQALLDKTGGLLNQTKALLTKKPKYRTANPPELKDNSDKQGPGRNIECTDPTEKCNHYLTNLIMNKDGNAIRIPNETENDVSESESDINCSDVSDKSSNTLKTSLDENDNIKLGHKMTDEQVDKSSPTEGCDLRAFDDVRGITEFVVQYDYTPDSELAIPVVRGEILHIGLDQQEDTEWYWAYSPRLRSYGYVPKLYVRIPVVTII